MKQGDTVFVRYIGNIQHWKKELSTALIASIGPNYITVNLNGDVCRFTKGDLRHESKKQAYRLYLTVEAYRQEIEVDALRRLMAQTVFVDLPVEKQRAIKAIIEA